MRLKIVLTLLSVLGVLRAQNGAPTTPAPKSTGLSELSDSFQALASRVRPAVVQIFSTGYVTAEESESTRASNLLSTQRSTGSGVILTPDGYIVTNNHVVEGARRIEVMLQGTALVPGRQVHITARLVGTDRQTDLAVIKIDREKLPFLQFGDSNKLHQGQIVLAFGNPLGLEGSMSMGVVSSAARRLHSEDTSVYVQTDAPINPGNSGGPLVDSEARVVGINTFILTQSGGSEGLGFAIPSNAVRNVYEQIKQDGHVHHGHIGVVVQTVTPPMAKGLELPQDWGVVVADVQPDGPAQKSGLHIRDVVYEANGQTIQDAPQLETMIDRLKLSETLHMKVLHNDEKLDIDVPVIERADDSNRFADMVDPDQNLVPKLGILGIEITDKLASMLPELRHQFGVVVAVRTSDPPYSGTPLEQGDVIFQIDRSPIATVKALRDNLDARKPGDTAVLEVQRNGKLMYLVIELE